MKKTIRNIYRKLIPIKFRRRINKLRGDRKGRKIYHEIVDYFNAHHELKGVYSKELQFLDKNKKAAVFPYEFVNKYANHVIEIYSDDLRKMCYVIHEEKRLYFPRQMDEDAIRQTYRALLIEQDPDSPHCYLSELFSFEESMTMVDVGCAEGILALSVAERASNIYLFECDDKWVEALKATFEPWKDKTRIIQKYVSNKSNEEYAMLDDYFDSTDHLFIKLDIEGAEVEAIKGASKTLQNAHIKVACCTYHKKDDEINIGKLLKNQGFHIQLSKGYMLWIHEKNMTPPFFRRGLIRAYK